MQRFLHVLRPLVVTTALLMTAWGCGGDTSPDGVVIGSGVIPETMPEGFPIPAGAVIGETSMDRDAKTTVVDLTTEGSLVSAVSAFTIGLVSSGYIVDQSEEQGDDWVIRFSRQDLRGTIALESGDDGVGATVTVVDP